jgi:hypothetical protein
VEHNRAVRFKLRAPVIFRWRDQSGRRKERVGYTRDISISGAFVICSTPPPLGTAVQLEIHLPPLERDTLQHLNLEVKGKVVRVMGTNQMSGFAAIGSFALHELIAAASTLRCGAGIRAN